MPRWPTHSKHRNRILTFTARKNAVLPWYGVRSTPRSPPLEGPLKRRRPRLGVRTRCGGAGGSGVAGVRGVSSPRQMDEGPPPEERPGAERTALVATAWFWRFGLLGAHRGLESVIKHSLRAGSKSHGFGI